MAQDNQLDLVALLWRACSAGHLNESQASRATLELLATAGKPPSRAELRRALADLPAETLAGLRRELFDAQVHAACDYHRMRRLQRPILPMVVEELSGLPTEAATGWQRLGDTLALLQRALDAERDLLFARGLSGLPKTQTLVLEGVTSHRQQLVRSCALGLLRPHDLCHIVAAGSPSGIDLSALSSLASTLVDELAAREQNLDEGDLVSLSVVMEEGRLLDRIAARLEVSESRSEQEGLLDRVLTWPTDAASRIVPLVCREPWSRERALLVLSLRTAMPWHDFENARTLLAEEAEKRRLAEERLASWCNDRPAEMLALYLACRGSESGPTVDAAGARMVGELLRPKDGARAAADFLARWRYRMPASEVRVLLARPGGARASSETLDSPSEATQEILPTRLVTPEPPSASPEPLLTRLVRPALARDAGELPGPTRPVVTAAVRDRPVTAAARDRPEAVRREPPLWRRRLQDFLSDNWYLALGLVMVVVGASLLAYYTWDKHWLVRYAVMPLLLAGFTAWLAWLGRRLGRADEALKGAGTLLHGAAVALLPVNFMAVALLADDPEVPYKALLVPLMGLVYIGTSGLGLRRWCRTVDADVPALLVPSLLVLNGLVLMAPLAHVTAIAEGALRPVLLVGFYLGFAMIAAAALLFVGRSSTTKAASSRHASSFFASTLLLTYVEVFLWVHGYLRVVPQVFTYAPLVLLTGGIVFALERRWLSQQRTPTRHVEVSFVGFAMVMLGGLLSLPQPYVRLLCLTLAGAVWLYQAAYRGQPLHYWLALSIFMLGAMSVATLPHFPLQAVAAVGLVFAWLLWLLAAVCRRERWQDLERAAASLMLTVLLLTAGTAMVAQWHFRSSPGFAGVVLLLVTATFMASAFKNNSMNRFLTSALLLPFALPYLGLADIGGRALVGNNLALGLGLLGLSLVALSRIRPLPLVVKTRSTLLLLYGVLGVATMLPRLLEDGLYGHGIARDALDLAALGLTILCLLLASFYARSWLGTILAAFVGVIALDPIAAALPRAFSHWVLGSGLASALLATLAVVAAHLLRGRKTLTGASEGDLWLGRYSFPLTRNDQTLFTTPLVVLALLLCAHVFIKVFTIGEELRFLSAGAVALTSATWTTLAIYWRQEPRAKFCVHAAWASLLFGGVLVSRELSPDMIQWPLVVTILTLRVGLIATRRLAKRWPWVEDLLAQPLALVLLVGTCIGACVLAPVVYENLDPAPVFGLMIVLLVELAVGALERRRYEAGSLFGVTALLAFLVLDKQWAPAQSGQIYGTVLFAVLVAVARGVTARPDWAERLKPLRRPLAVLALGIVLFLTYLALDRCARMPWRADLSPGRLMESIGFWLALVVWAWIERSVVLSFLAVIAAYMLVPVLLVPEAATDPTYRWTSYYLAPWCLGLLALVMTVGHGALRRFAPTPSPSDQSWRSIARQAERWLLFAPAAAAAALAALMPLSYQSPNVALQLIGPALAAVAFGILAWNGGITHLYYLSWLSIASSTLVTAHRLLGSWLRELGTDVSYVTTVGIALAVVLTHAVALIFRPPDLRRTARYFAAFGASGVLLLLSAHFLSHPDLVKVSAIRFVLSGAMALLAGAYSRAIAAHAAEGSWQRVLWRTQWHLGLAVALWCWASLLPALRTPTTAFIALAVPLVYFYVRAERSPTIGDHHTAATVLAFTLLGLYAVHGIFQLLVFPEMPTTVWAYHTSAPVLLIVSLILFRLDAIGGTPWSAFYGGVGLVVSVFFAVTAIPGLSPFRAPVAAALVACGLGHVFTVAAADSSPVARAFLRLGRLSAERWRELCRSWGFLLLIGVHGVFLWGCSQWPHRLIAVALAGTATLLLHHGARARRSAYLVLAVLEMAAALHVDSFGTGILPARYAGLGILALWTLLLVLHPLLRRFYDYRRSLWLELSLAAIATVDVVVLKVSIPLGLAELALLSLLVGLTFRQYAADSGEKWPRWVWHLGLASAMVCGALLVPPLRAPWAVLVVLAIPVVYFHVRAELGWGGGDHHLPGVVAAAIWAIIYLTAVALSPSSHDLTVIVIRPEHRLPYGVLAVALSMSWLRFSAILDSFRLRLVAGAFFGAALLTSFWGIEVGDPWGPYAHLAPYSNVFFVVGLGHLFFGITGRPGLVRDIAARFLGGTPLLLSELRRWWVPMVFVAAHAVVAWALLAGSQSVLAPVALLALASLAVHQAIRARQVGSLYLGIFELLVAIHAGPALAIAAYWSFYQAAWGVLLVWAVLLLCSSWLADRFGRADHSPLCAFALVGIGHVIANDPSLPTSLLLAGGVAALTALTPTSSISRSKVGTAAASWLVLAAPAYLAIVSQWPSLRAGIIGPGASRSLLGLAAFFTVLGFVIDFGQARLPALASVSPRVFHETVALLRRHGPRLHRAALLLATAVAIAVAPLRWSTPLSDVALAVLLVVLVGQSAGWFREGAARDRARYTFAAEICLFSAYVVVRHYLVSLYPDRWLPQFDVYAEILVALVLASAKELLPLGRHVRIPVVATLVGLPVATLAWILVNHQGVNFVLLVLGINSIIFAFFGRDERDSPYNIVATVGFVSFVLVAFRGKLALTEVHAYVIPVALGVLVLSHLFAASTTAVVRNRVRWAALLAILGSAAYYALAGSRAPLVHHTVFLLLGLAAVAAGGLLRMRLYLMLGVTAVFVDLVSLLVHVVVAMDRTARMTALGVLVLAIGVAVVAGAAYFKTHRNQLLDRLSGIRARLGDWE